MNATWTTDGPSSPPGGCRSCHARVLLRVWLVANDTDRPFGDNSQALQGLCSHADQRPDVRGHCGQSQRRDGRAHSARGNGSRRWLRFTERRQRRGLFGKRRTAHEGSLRKCPRLVHWVHEQHRRLDDCPVGRLLTVRRKGSGPGKYYLSFANPDCPAWSGTKPIRSHAVAAFPRQFPRAREQDFGSDSQLRRMCR